VPDQLHVPFEFWATEPVEAVKVTASSKSAKLPVFVAEVFSAALTEALSADTVGDTSVNDTLNEVVAVEPSALVAVIVTVYGLVSSPVPDQPHVPDWLPDCVTVPVEAVKVAASSKSAKLPVFAAGVFSAALTDVLSADMLGDTSVNDTPNEVVAVEPSALVAVIVTVYGLCSSPVPDQLHVPDWLPDCVTVPVDAVSNTASSKSAKLPVFAAEAFSAALTDALSADTVGDTSVKDTPKDVVAVEPSALVAVIVTV
jgi:hypothetical protein